MSLTVTESQLRSQIKAAYEAAEQIENRYPDGPITNREDLEENKRLLQLCDELESKLAEVEDTAARR